MRKTHWIRGTILIILLGLPCLISGGLAILAIIDTVISGWIPSRWFSGNAADWIWGTGIAGDASNYIVIVIGGGIAIGLGAVIRWGYIGSDKKLTQI